MGARSKKDATGKRNDLKESLRWIEGYDRVAEMAADFPGTRLVYLADREADLIPLMRRAQELGEPQRTPADSADAGKCDWRLPARAASRLDLAAPNRQEYARARTVRWIGVDFNVVDDAVTSDRITQCRITVGSRYGRDTPHSSASGITMMPPWGYGYLDVSTNQAPCSATSTLHIRPMLYLLNVQQLNIKDQVRVRRNRPDTVSAVAHLRRHNNRALAPYLHALHPHVPALDYLAASDPEAERRTPHRRIKLGAMLRLSLLLIQPARVIDYRGRANSRLLASADNSINLLQGNRRCRLGRSWSRRLSAFASGHSKGHRQGNGGIGKQLFQMNISHG